MNASYFVVYNHKGKLNKQGKALIQIRVYFKRFPSKFISTETYVAPEHWNERKKMVDESHPAQGVRQIPLLLKKGLPKETKSL
jgi:hypothetical protein